MKRVQVESAYEWVFLSILMANYMPVHLKDKSLILSMAAFWWLVNQTPFVVMYLTTSWKQFLQVHMRLKPARLSSGVMHSLTYQTHIQFTCDIWYRGRPEAELPTSW